MKLLTDEKKEKRKKKQEQTNKQTNKQNQTKQKENLNSSYIFKVLSVRLLAK